ncbi:glutamate-5-semialdehyde dehydrogenase [candidate division NPL-UPA2 bacterium Unc8]|uniref:Gamma-glutamyl phosphate reductase n=1 Tax=candidate division NPL-UPA2 bacterium Unc8 TaxID=1980939 RepID=A0A399FY89_UNCN2|nr:Gamma-glutamyl phosphate reductase [Bacillota bacterium]RII00379.1 MAG: glutamate-5-semialdehyde dehydrogenase [candidate division NPL-UPA2 bacterium Unc8]
MTLKEEMFHIAMAAREAAKGLANLSTEVKNKALINMARAIRKENKVILAENEIDIKEAERKGISRALLDRLMLTSARVEEISSGLEKIADLPDPIGETIKSWKTPNDLEISKVRVPIGVLVIIYESRPNVTVDAAGLCLKSGNSVILRGGSEATHTNVILAHLISEAAEEVGIPRGAIQIVRKVERKAVKELLGLSQWIDLVIPRGGEGLIRMVGEFSTIPVIKHYQGICHTYIDEAADLKMAEEIAFNAKVSRPGVCNAMETLLVHRGIAKKFLPSFSKRLLKAGVEIRGCAETRKMIPEAREAVEDDWKTEYLDLILSIRIVSNLEAAIAHIEKYGSGHSEAIVTDSYRAAKNFLQVVDAACVYVNASTRFTDGGQFGMGAEIGISTDKLHARGPMGLEELTSYKYVIQGEGQIRLK